MDQTGIWNLFFATGLPEAYLATRAEGESTAVSQSPPEPSKGISVSPMEG